MTVQNSDTNLVQTFSHYEVTQSWLGNQQFPVLSHKKRLIRIYSNVNWRGTLWRKMCEKGFVQTNNVSNRKTFLLWKNFTFNSASLIFVNSSTKFLIWFFPRKMGAENQKRADLFYLLLGCTKCSNVASVSTSIKGSSVITHPKVWVLI